MTKAADALPDREEAMGVPTEHFVNGHLMQEPFPPETAMIMFGVGCFWGGERRFWEADNVYSTQVGYAGGFTKNPTYQEVCSGMTGHAEVIRVVYYDQPGVLENLLAEFWEVHNPTQGMRQGNDIGTQYRSAIFSYHDEQLAVILKSKGIYQAELDRQAQSSQTNCGHITTEIAPAPAFYYAEEYHQQYLAKNPKGYCGLGGTGVCFPAQA